jgi:hypothetical protein
MIKQKKGTIEIQPIDVSRASLAEKEAVKLLSNSARIVVRSGEDYEKAGALLKTVKTMARELDDYRKTITRPIDMAKEAVMSMFRGPIEKLKSAELKLKNGMKDWKDREKAKVEKKQRELEEKAREEEEAERKRIERQQKYHEEKGNKKEAKARKQAAKQVHVPVPVVRKEDVKAEGVQEALHWNFRIIDADLLPREFLKPDESKIREVVNETRGSIKIPGVDVYPERRIRA